MTTERNRESSAALRKRYRAAGLVLLTVWVPLKKRNGIRHVARQARNQHLSEGGWLDKWTAEGVYDGRDK